MSSSRPARRSGFVLVIVLGMTMALSVVVIGFHRRARGHIEQADRMRMAQQSLNYAHSGLQAAIAALRGLEDSGRDGPAATPLKTKHTLTFDQGTCRLELQPASGRVNLNHLKDDQKGLNRPVIDQFLRLIDLINAELPQTDRLGYGLAGAIIDWTDNDDEPTLLPFIKRENRGVESAYYESRDPPYACANRPFQTLRELLLVKGMTVSAFDRLEPHVTIKGEGLINVNYASTRVLESFGPEFDKSIVRIIAKRRLIKPFESLSEIGELPGINAPMYETIRRYGTVSESDDYFHVRARADVGRVKREVRALIRRNTGTHHVDVVHYEEI